MAGELSLPVHSNTLQETMERNMPARFAKQTEFTRSFSLL